MMDNMGRDWLDRDMREYGKNPFQRASLHGIFVSVNNYSIQGVQDLNEKHNFVRLYRSDKMAWAPEIYN